MPASRAPPDLDAAAEGGSELMPLGEYPFSKRYGWVADRFGVSWQIAPADLGEMMSAGTPEQIARVTQAFLPMKKLDLAELRSAYESAPRWPAT